MLERLKKVTTHTYRVNNDFIVDIVKTVNNASTQDLFEAWLYLEHYGYKQLMFGMYAKTEEDFIEYVVANIFDYINLYIETKNDMEEYYIEKEL